MNKLSGVSVSSNRYRFGHKLFVKILNVENSLFEEFMR